MDAALSGHPTRQVLSSFSLGKLDKPSANVVSKHLEQCSDCRKHVAEMSADSFLGRVRGAQGPAMSTYGQSQTSHSTSGRVSAKAVSPPPTHTLPPGLADHPDYEIKRELGRGGMGVVYLAHNRLMGRDEVLKVMARHIMERPGVLERFVREIRAVAKLRHPNIVTAYHAARLGDSVVFAMEYVDGLDLSRMVKAKGALPVGHACNFIYQAALGLQHACEEGLVHRDIKPGNLMLARKGNKATIKILDFGLAKASREERVNGALTHEGQALGTPDFIAPEQIINAPNVDIRADIYSLGGTLYYLLIGQPPFHANSLYDLYQAHMSRDADPLNLIRPEVPVELAALVAKMMAKEPKRRFQTPGQVAQALSPFFKKDFSRSRTQRLEESRGTGHAESKRDSQTGVAPQPAPAVSEVDQRQEDATQKRSHASIAWESLIPIRHEEPLVEREEPELAPRTPSDGPNWKFPIANRRVALGAAAFILALLGVIVITIKTRHGETKITAKDDVPFNVTTEDLNIENKPIIGDSPPRRKSDGPDTKPLDEPLARNKARAPAAANRRAQIFHGTWHVEGEELVQASADPGGKSMVFGDRSWSNYDFSVEVKGIGGRNVWIFFSYTDTGNHCNFYPGPGNYYGLGTVVDGQVRHESAPGSLEPDRWYRVKIEVRGSEARCFLDGREVLHHYDARLTNGMVGLGSWETACHFRNIEVRTPDRQLLWRGLPELPE